MVTAELDGVKNVEEFHEEICKIQKKAHGDRYCEHHSVIQKMIKDHDCKSYKEFGTHQGASAAAAMLAMPNKIQLVDTDFTKYRKYLKPLAESYCKENNIDLKIYETSSASISSLGDPCDLLFIDSLHKAYHLEAELELHKNSVRKYILFHDVNNTRGFPEVIHKFCNQNDWKVIERSDSREGYMLIKKI
jgi:predicted O-methyltransferase YrrM